MNLEPYAWPGGYLIEWVMDDGLASLCASCATKLESEGHIDSLEPLIHEAGSEGFTCDECQEDKT